MSITEVIYALCEPRCRPWPLYRGRQNAPANTKPYAIYNLRHLTPPSRPDKLPVDSSGHELHRYHSAVHLDLGFYGPGAFEAGMRFISPAQPVPYEASKGWAAGAVARIGTLQDLTGLVTGTAQNEEYAFLEMSLNFVFGANVEVGLIERVIAEAKLLSPGVGTMTLPDPEPGPDGSWISSLGVIDVRIEAED